MRVIAHYAIATLIPQALLLLGATLWGSAAVLALIWLTLVAAVMDTVLLPPKLDDENHEPWSDRLALGLGLGHLILLPLVLIALAGDGLSFGQKLALFFATASFFGQVSHPNAHELIHRRPWHLRAIGAAVYTSVGFGHHVSAHRMVHHRHVGTEEDPNTPLPGESFWAYLPRAWVRSFLAGLAAEEAKLERKGLPGRSAHNPYLIWVGGAALSLVLGFWIAGFAGGLALIALGALTGGQILMSDYLQHYGLQRLELPNGRVEPVAAHHSWNAPRGFSSYLMMNAPAHSEHHMHPDRPYDRLNPEADVPKLPYSMPVMATLATVPSVWHRVMDKRAVKVMEKAQVRLAEADKIRPRRPAARADTQGSDSPSPDSARDDAPGTEAPKDDTEALLDRISRAVD